VLNLQSKRTVSGTVVGRGQVAVSVATPRLPAASDATSSLGSVETAAPVSVAANSNSQVAPKAE
jgi:flagella basal body P-ring formation protein FlgA